MSRHYWVLIGSVGTLILLASITAGVWYSIDYEANQRQQRQSIASEYADRADEQARHTCAEEIGLTEFLRCRSDLAKAKRDEGREYYDLGAQQDMALWTFTILWVSAIALLATVLGVILVAFTYRATKTTLDVTEEFNKDARENVRREFWAYLSVEPGGINQLIGSSNLMGHVQIHNVGRLPARAVTPVVRMTRVDKEAATNKKFDKPSKPKATTRVIQPGATMTMGCRDEDLIPFSTALVDGGYIFVWGIVYYRDGYDELRFTRFCHRYHWESRDRDIEAISRNGLPSRADPLITSDKARYHPHNNEAD